MEDPSRIIGGTGLSFLQAKIPAKWRGVGVEILLEHLGAAEVVAFDFDPRMVARARARTSRFGERAKIFVGDAEHMALPKASFDAVVEFGIIHHVPNWRGAHRGVCRD